MHERKGWHGADAVQIAELFKAYDVRGLAPDELTPEIAYAIGRAMVASLKLDQVAVGSDMRVSGPALSAALIDGIRDQGADVTDIGLVSTDALYFVVGRFGYSAGVMVTASHNPAKYNGLKICREDARALSLSSGLAEIRDLVLDGNLPILQGRRGALERQDMLDAYGDHVLGLVDAANIKPLKIAVDAGNGMAGLTIPRIFKHLPCTIVPLYFELDGTFPNHEANPLEPENVEELQQLVLRESCDLGVAFDGDADRMFLIDERGRFISGDMVTAMVAAKMLERDPGAAVVYNLICSRAVPETIARLGGRPIRSRVGHSYIKATMRAEDAVFGGEHSGHFYFRDNWYADSGMIALLTMLELLSEADRPLSECLRPLDTYVRSGEINSDVVDPDATMQAVEAFYEGTASTIDHLDGVTIQFADWWFNLRPSNTQPLLRLNVEADDSEILSLKMKEVLGLIRSTPDSTTRMHQTTVNA
jgi:phosphomannomutase